MVREAIFDMIGPKVMGATVLDLFSGTGLLGLEAMSRGAEEVYFVEQDRQTCGLLKENLSIFCAKPYERLFCMSVERALKQLKSRKAHFDIVLMDPPYALDVAPLLNTLATLGIVNPNGWIVVERETGSLMGGLVESLLEIKRKRYGQTTVYVFQPLIKHGVLE